MNNETIEKKETAVVAPNPSQKDTVTNTTQPTIPNKTLAEPMEGSLSEGFNLMPKMTVAQQAVETKKSTFNIGSALGLIALVVVSLIIVGFNIVSKQQLNQAKKDLYEYESSVNQKVDLIISNNAIVDRLVMYEVVKKNSFSHKEVIDFIQSITTKLGTIELRDIEISDSLAFALEGSASSLEEVSKLWYLLGINENIDTVNLDSVGKTAVGARFSFEGKLSESKFIKK